MLGPSSIRLGQSLIRPNVNPTAAHASLENARSRARSIFSSTIANAAVAYVGIALYRHGLKVMACIVMDYIVMFCIVIAYVVMAYIGMAYVVMA